MFAVVSAWPLKATHLLLAARVDRQPYGSDPEGSPVVAVLERERGELVDGAAEEDQRALRVEPGRPERTSLRLFLVHSRAARLQERGTSRYRGEQRDSDGERVRVDPGGQFGGVVIGHAANLRTGPHGHQPAIHRCGHPLPEMLPGWPGRRNRLILT